MTMFEKIEKLLPYIVPIITPIVKIIIEKLRSIKDKPCFYIYELFFQRFSNFEDEKKEYQIKGRIVGKTNKNYLRFLKIELPFDCEWKDNSNYSCYKKGYSGWKQSGDIIKPKIEENVLTIDYSEDLKKTVTYNIVGNYTVPNEPKDLSYAYSFLEVSSKKKDENGKEKEEKLKVIKCPNIRKSWLLFYIVFSILFSIVGLFLGTVSILSCINNWSYFVNASFEVCFMFVVFGLILLILMVYFVCLSWKAISAYFVLIKMKKFGIPAKPEIVVVGQKLLVPTIFEFMTGTETIDNIL